MARLLRALGLSRASYDGKHKQSFDGGNAATSDTEAEIGCITKRPSSGSRRKTGNETTEFERRASFKTASCSSAKGSNKKTSSYNVSLPAAEVQACVGGLNSPHKAPCPCPGTLVQPPKAADTQPGEPVPKCADVDTVYSLPADSRTDSSTLDQSAYCCVEPYGVEPDAANISRRKNQVPVPIASSPLDLDACQDETTRPIASDDARAPQQQQQQQQQPFYDPPWPSLDNVVLRRLRDAATRAPDKADPSNEYEPFANSDNLAARYPLLPRGSRVLEPSEQSAFQRVSKGRSAVGGSPAASSRSSLCAPSACCSQLNNNVPADCPCAHCTHDSPVQPPDVAPTEEKCPPMSERVLPRMGVSAVKSRGTLAASVSATSGFQRPAASSAALPTSASYSGQPRTVLPPRTSDSPSEEVVWHRQTVHDEPLSDGPRRRHSQNAAEMQARHRSAAEGPYDCPWDDRRQALEALLLNNAGVNLTAVLRNAHGSPPAAPTPNPDAETPREVDRRDEPQSNTATRRSATHVSDAQRRQRSADYGGESALCQQAPNGAPASHSNSASPHSKSDRHRKQKSAKRRHGTASSASPASSASSGPSVSPLALFDNHSSSNDICLRNSSTAELAEIIDPNLLLENTGWYYPKVTRTLAETLLQNEKEGSFLVRRCETCPQDFSLSIRNDHAQNGIVHMRISLSPKGYILGGFSQPYESVPILVHHFMFYALPIRGVPSQVLIHPIIKSLKESY